MSWVVYGSDLQFEVGSYGLSVLGTGRHAYSEAARFSSRLDMSILDAEPAYWQISRAPDAARLGGIRLLSLEPSDIGIPYLKKLLDPDALRNTEEPVGIIEYYKTDLERRGGVYFSVFLPDRYFHCVLDLLKLQALGCPMDYRMTFEWDGFLPPATPQHPEFVRYDEWLRGRPFVSKGFTFHLERSGQEDP